MNYFMLNDKHSFMDLLITGDSPIPPVFSVKAEEYKIEFNYYYLRRNGSKMTGYNHLTFLQEQLIRLVKEKEIKLILSQDLDYYYIVKDIVMEVSAISNHSCNYKITVIVEQYKRFINNPIIEIPIENIETLIDNKVPFDMNNNGINAYPVFNIEVGESEIKELTLTIGNNFITLYNLKPFSNVCIDFYLQDIYSDTELLNNSANGDFFNIPIGYTPCSVYSTNLESINKISYILNSITY